MFEYQKANLYTNFKPPMMSLKKVIFRNYGSDVTMFFCCCCCSAYLSSCHRPASDTNLLDDQHTSYCIDYFVLGGIRTCVVVSNDPMIPWISSNSCPLNLLLIQSHQAEIIIQGRNSVTRVRVEPKSFDQGRRKKDAFTLSTTLPTND